MPLDNIDNGTTGNTPPAATPPDQQQPATPSSPSQNSSAQTQPQNSGQGTQPSPQAKSPNLEDQLISGAAPQPDPIANHPLVKKAGVMNAVATALSGGQRYNVTIDDQGNRVRTPVPVSGRHLALAIAMEAVQGSLTGLAAGRGRGPGAAGAAAMAQAASQRQQQDEHQDQQAQADFANKASAYSANLRTRAMAQEIGMRDEQSHKDWVAQHASTAAYIRQNNPASIIRDDASEAEVTTPEFTKQALQNGWTAIPIGYEPRFDAQGNHFTKDGTALHNNTFMIVDSGKLTVPQDVISKAQSWSLPGFTNRNGETIKLPDSLDLKVGSILDVSNKVAALDQEQKDLSQYYGYLADKGVKGPDGKPLAAPDLKALVRQNPSLISNITGAWQNHFGDSPSAALRAMKDSVPGKGALANLYGGKEMLDKYDLLKSTEKKTAEKSAEAAVDIDKEKKLIPIKVATAAGEAKARAAAMATSSKNEDGSWNPASIPVSLVEANMDPSQLSKRGTDYNQKLQDANTYSLQKYGRPFDIAQATTDYKQANNPQVQSMLKMVGAMSAPNGELAIAVNAAKALPQMNSGMLNKVFNITETQFGSDSATNFHTAMIGFSDLYAKVMGGGAGTDALRQSAMDVLKDGYSRGQIAGSIKVLQQQIEARRNQMVGENPYLRKQFGGQAQTPNTNNVQAPPASLLKEGVNTKFANGQIWSLRGGQPVQVQ